MRRLTRRLSFTAVALAAAVGLVQGTATAANATGTSQASVFAAYSCDMNLRGGYWYAGWYDGMTAVPRADIVTSAGIEAQCQLRETGYYSGAIDGYFGPQSQAAMKGFQRHVNKVHGVGLAVDGWPGPKSWPWLRR